MKRRTFLAAATTAGTVALQTSCKQAAGPPAITSKMPGDFELDEVSLAEITAGLHEGKCTSGQLAELYLGRIEALNRKGAKLAAVLTVNPDTMAIARYLDEERKNNHIRSSLHGVPIRRSCRRAARSKGIARTGIGPKGCAEFALDRQGKAAAFAKALAMKMFAIMPFTDSDVILVEQGLAVRESGNFPRALPPKVPSR